MLAHLLIFSGLRCGLLCVVIVLKWLLSSDLASHDLLFVFAGDNELTFERISDFVQLDRKYFGYFKKAALPLLMIYVRKCLNWCNWEWGIDGLVANFSKIYCVSSLTCGWKETEDKRIHVYRERIENSQ